MSAKSGMAEQKLFTYTVRYVMGENESRQELRELATLEAKRQILEQVGVYIEAETLMKEYIKETETTFEDESEYKKEILAITAGVTKTEIASEEWKEENGVFVLYLTCNITVDTEDVNRKIQELVRDRQKLDDMKMLQDEVARLQNEMEELRKRLERAEDSQVEEIKQQRTQISDEFSAVEWYEMGRTTDDIDKEIEYFTYAIERKPDWNWPYIKRGLAYNDKGYLDRAIDDYNKAIQIDPNNTTAYAGRGIAYSEKDDFDLAIADYNRAIQIYPNNIAAIVMRGQLYNNKGYYDRAMTDYNKVILIDPNNAIFYFGRGLIYAKKNSYDLAISDYSKAIQIDSNNAEAYCCRGLVYDLKGDYDLAIADYNKAIQINPNYALAYYSRGLAYWYGLKDKINAHRSFRKAKELGYPDAQYELDKIP